jgi:hypothetical protein
MLKRFINITNLARIAVAALTLSLLPILHTSFYNRATGDEIGYGILTRQAWASSGSLTEVVKAAVTTVRQSYYTWDSRILAIFLNTLQPEVFSEKAYPVVTVVTVALWVAVTVWLMYLVLVCRMGYGKSGFALITSLFLAANIHFVPGTSCALFWGAGINHYTLPYLMCLLLLGLMIQYCGGYDWRCLLAMVFLAGLIGISNYQLALFAPLATVLVIAASYCQQRKKAVFFLLLPLSAGLAGLAILMAAPGNKVRAESGTNTSEGLRHALESIALSFVAAVRDIGVYILERPLAVIVLALMLLAMYYVCLNNEKLNSGGGGYTYPLPGLFFALTFCIYAAMQTPEIYAGVWVTEGVANINYLVFCLLVLANGLYFFSWLRIRNGKGLTARAQRFVLAATVFLLLLAPVFYSNVRLTSFWKAFRFVTSGNAQAFREHMQQWDDILLDENVRDAVLPFVNSQGPFMDIWPTGDPDAWMNQSMRGFYGKDSVVVIDRAEWNERYGQ